MEEWRSAVGYEGRLEVSSLGRVRSVPRVIAQSNGHLITIRPRIRKLWPNSGGYPCVSYNGQDLDKRVHVMVLEAFVGPRPAGMESRHLNGDPSDARLCNLAWSTHVENIRDKRAHGTAQIGEKHGRSKLTEHDIKRIIAIGRTKKQPQICAEFGISQAQVSRILNGRRWGHLREAVGG